VRRTLLLLSLCLWACGPSAEGENESGVTIPLPPAVPAAEPPPQPPEQKNGSVPEPEAPEEKAIAGEEADKPAPAAEKAKPPAPQPKAAEKPEAEPPEAEPATKTVERTGERPPLSDSLIASTIRRIGYPCPSVRSTSAISGDGPSPSGYRITCSSGDTYRGTVINGHLRFRKFGD
jgi:hypothetical protein